MNRVCVTLCAVVVSACSPNSLSGSISGTKLNAKDAAFFITHDNAGQPNGAIVRISDQADVCDSLTSAEAVKSSTNLTLHFVKKSGDGTIIAPNVGPFTVVTSTDFVTNSSVVTGALDRLDSTCTNTLGASGYAEHGSAQVDAFDTAVGGHMSGSFEMWWGAQDERVTGNFSAVYCNSTNSLPLLASCK